MGCFVYSVETARRRRLPMARPIRVIRCSIRGKTLYFTASTDVGLTAGWLDLSSFQHPFDAERLCGCLKKGDANPVSRKRRGEGRQGGKGKEGDKDKEEDKTRTKEKDSGKDSEKERAKKARRRKKFPRSPLILRASRSAL